MATVKPDDANVEKSTERVFAAANGRMAARKTARIADDWRSTERAGWWSRSKSSSYIQPDHAKDTNGFQDDKFGC